MLGKGKGIGKLLIGAAAAAFLGRIVIGFAGGFGVIGLLAAGIILYGVKAKGMLGDAARFAGVALSIVGIGGLLGI